MTAVHWKESEVEELMGFLTDGERHEMQVLVHFAKEARARPDSMWGPGGAWGPDGPSPVAWSDPEQPGMMSSADFVEMLDFRLGELLRIATIRKGLLN